MMPGIAIVGMACRYPDATGPAELWQNVLARRRAFRRIPSERLRLEDYGSPDRATPDAIYSTEAAVLEGWEFDRARYRVVGSTFRAADLAHWLALEVASQALADAGFADGSGLPRETTGAIVGNTLTGEFSRAQTLRLRWPYVRRVLEAELSSVALSEAERRALLGRVEAAYKRPFEPVGEETLAGGLSNTIAGRICNQFDLKGGGYVVDGACSASLLSVITACRSLEAGDLDVALAGGVDLSLDPFELVGFAKTGALAPEEMRVYDARSQGFWPGEGAGFVVLMREDEARDQGRRCYAVIRGWGVSSDGSGGITRPEVEGQMLALARAYRRAGFGAHTIAYFEGHGTGTAVGDAAELEVLTRVRRESGEAGPAAIGSIKANFGHTKAAAGIAGLLKATLALHHQVIPPTTGCDEPHPRLAGPNPALEVVREGRAWPDGRPLRAAVSAMGFGGINTHVVLEGGAKRRPAPAGDTQALLDSWQDGELFLFGAATAAGLARQVERVLAYAARLSRAELADLAHALEHAITDSQVRAAVIASKPAGLVRALETLVTWLAGGVERRMDASAGVFLGGSGDPRIAFLFSGQAAPVYGSGGALERRFPQARARYRDARLPRAADPTATAVAQPAIVTGSLAALAALEALGIEAGIAAGHSLGEITALHWAGAMDADAVLEIARVRGRAMMDTPGPPSGMLSIAASAAEVVTAITGTGAVIAGHNLPRQTVVSGENRDLETVAARARARGWRVSRLPVSHAFHSPLMLPAAGALEAQLGRTRLARLARRMASTITGRELSADADVSELLVRQLTSPVRFMDAVRTLEGVELVIEVGPGRILSTLAEQLLAAPAIPLDAGGDSMLGLLAAAGAAWSLGCDLRHEVLFEGRFTRDFALDWNPRFLMNPCEQAPVSDVAPDLDLAQPEAEPDAPGSSPAPAPVAGVHDADSVLALLRQRVAERVELPVDAVTAGSRFLDDLHLNSIAVGQLVAAVARELGLKPSASPTDYADASVLEAAQALADRLRSGEPEDEPEAEPAGVETWVRAFTVEHVPRPAPAAPEPRRTGAEHGGWRILAPADHPLRAPIERRLADLAGAGIVVCLPEEPGDSALDLLLEGARAALATRPRGRFVVVQCRGGGSGFAKSLHLESPDGGTCVVEVPFDDPRAAEWVARESLAAEGFTEARYDANGGRTEPVLRVAALEPAPTNGASAPAPAPLAADDVVLVTGGGKGIAAECALALAREYGCRLALLGRSDPATDAELARNLERMRTAGVTARYQSADVTDAGAVHAAVQRAESSLGHVTAVLHGAGHNAPELLRSLSREALVRTVAAKVRGAEHVLAAVDPGRLKLFVAFGSVIARSGLRGEADYALANEWLTLLTERLGRRAPRCRALSIEWSVWSGVGMGERLGRVDALSSQGVTPIGPDEGVAIFRRLVASRIPASSVVVSGRFGRLPTLATEPAELPLLRFLERPRVHVPGVELVVDSDLSPTSDPYLEDHVFEGVRLFPAVMGLEAMAQTAMALTGSTKAPRFEDVRFDRPVAVPDDGQTIRVAALIRAPGIVDVTLRSRETGFEVDHFRAVCVMPQTQVTGHATNGDAPHASHRPGASALPAPASANEPVLALEPSRDLYGGILFHTGRFRRLGRYHRLRARECVVEILPDRAAPWFGRYLPAGLVLGDPAARDTTIHAVQACIPHATILPVGVERLEIDPIPPDAPRRVSALEVARDDRILVYEVEVRDAAGAIRERWQGLRLKIVADRGPQGPWPPALLVPHLERRLKDLLPGAAVSVALLDSATSGRQSASDAAIRAALGLPATILRRPDGKPEVDGANVSAAHAGALTLAVATDRPVGCDLEPVRSRTREDWTALLGEDGVSLAGRIQRASGEAFDASATRVWSTIESARKAGAPPRPLRLGAAASGAWVTIGAGRLEAATLVTAIRGTEGSLVLAVLLSPGTAPCAPTNTGTSSASKKPISSATSTTSAT